MDFHTKIHMKKSIWKFEYGNPFKSPSEFMRNSYVYTWNSHREWVKNPAEFSAGNSPGFFQQGYEASSVASYLLRRLMQRGVSGCLTWGFGKVVRMKDAPFLAELFENCVSDRQGVLFNLEFHRQKRGLALFSVGWARSWLSLSQ